MGVWSEQLDTLEILASRAATCKCPNRRVMPLHVRTGGGHSGEVLLTVETPLVGTRLGWHIIRLTQGQPKRTSCWRLAPLASQPPFCRSSP